MLWSAGIYQSRDLFEAVQKGRLEEARVRLMTGEDVNALHVMGRTVLHLAASKSTAAVQLVLEFKPDVKKVDLSGFTALHQAAASNVRDSEEITDLLIKAGVDINTRNKFNRSAVDECLVIGNFVAMKVLVTAGACIKHALMLAKAKEMRGTEMMEYLEAKAGDSLEFSLEDEKEAFELSIKELQRKVEMEREARRKSVKKELDRVQTNLMVTTEKMKLEVKSRAKELENHYTEEKEKIAHLEREIEKFKLEEGEKIKDFVKEIQELSQTLDEKGTSKVKYGELRSFFECPVCLDSCRDKIWQCLEGHILCHQCAERKELKKCPQCKVPFSTNPLSRNRVLENLAGKILPPAPRESQAPAAGAGAGAAGVVRSEADS